MISLPFSINTFCPHSTGETMVTLPLKSSLNLNSSFWASSVPIIGLKNIESILGNNVYPRLRFGVGSDFAKGRQVDFVLGEFTDDEKIDLSLLIERASEMSLAFTTLGVERTMNQYNK